MSTDDNDSYGDVDKSNLEFIYEQFLRTSNAVINSKLVIFFLLLGSFLHRQEAK